MILRHGLDEITYTTEADGVKSPERKRPHMDHAGLGLSDGGEDNPDKDTQPKGRADDEGVEKSVRERVLGTHVISPEQSLVSCHGSIVDMLAVCATQRALPVGITAAWPGFPPPDQVCPCQAVVLQSQSRTLHPCKPLRRVWLVANTPWWIAQPIP